MFSEDWARVANFKQLERMDKGVHPVRIWWVEPVKKGRKKSYIRVYFQTPDNRVLIKPYFLNYEGQMFLQCVYTAAGVSVDSDCAEWIEPKFHVGKLVGKKRLIC